MTRYRLRQLAARRLRKGSDDGSLVLLRERLLIRLNEPGAMERLGTLLQGWTERRDSLTPVQRSILGRFETACDEMESERG